MRGFRLLSSGIFLSVVALGCAPQQASTKHTVPAAQKREAVVKAPPTVGFRDSGNFQLYKNEQPIVSTDFSWTGDRYTSERTLTIAGQSVKSSMTIALDRQGEWRRVELKAPTGAVSIVRDKNKASLTHRSKTTTFALKGNHVLFENFAPSLLSLGLRKYDPKGGRQKFQLFLLAGKTDVAFLERKETVARAVNGRDLQLTHFVYSLAGLELHAWVDKDNKVYLLEVPAQRAAYVRRGFETLRAKAPDDPLLSKPTHAVVTERNVKVPMRDKVTLATNIYRPKAADKYPVILIRTPYKKENNELQAMFYARRGYVVATQDVRGRFASPGVWEPFVNEAKDGHDAIEWLARQKWSSGKVGMIGASYVGWVQWWAASQRPPHLTTIIPNVAPPDPFYNIPYEYGVFFILGAIWWADILESNATGDLSGRRMKRIGEKKYSKVLRSLPVIDLDKKILGKKNPYWRKWIAHPTNDSYWKPANFLDKLAKVRIPVFHQSGWFDGDGIGSKLNYLKMASHRHPHQKLILGPWGHTAEAHRRFRERDFGPAAIVDLQRQYLRWFDRWLKGIKNGIDTEPLVELFVMGSNKWLKGKKYPLRKTRFDKWYLASGGKANTSLGNGTLSRARSSVARVDRYVYDPADPTPDPRYYETPERKDGSTVSEAQLKLQKEKYHREVTERRKDILVYVSKPLTKDYTFAGPISAVLYAASSAKDTDWFVSLSEIDEQGKIFPLTLGKIRARFRRSMSKPQLLVPAKVYRYELDLWQTGITITKGRSLRVEVSSAVFPVFSRNLNTGGHNETETRHQKASQTIYHSRRYPSHLILPAIP